MSTSCFGFTKEAGQVFRFFNWMMVLILCTAGCGDADSRPGRDAGDLDGVGHVGNMNALENRRVAGDGSQMSQMDAPPNEDAGSGGSASEKITGSEGKRSDGNPITHADLAQSIAKSKDRSTWHNGERTVGELAGMWTAVNGSGHLLVFMADGGFSEDLAGNMTEGVYAISDEGRILTYSKANGVGLRSHFRFDGNTIRGPLGPSPLVEWKRSSRTGSPADK